MEKYPKQMKRDKALGFMARQSKKGLTLHKRGNWKGTFVAFMASNGKRCLMFVPDEGGDAWCLYSDGRKNEDNAWVKAINTWRGNKRNTSSPAEFKNNLMLLDFFRGERIKTKQRDKRGDPKSRVKKGQSEKVEAKKKEVQKRTAQNIKKARTSPLEIDMSGFTFNAEDDLMSSSNDLMSSSDDEGELSSSDDEEVPRAGAGKGPYILMAQKGLAAAAYHNSLEMAKRQPMETDDFVTNSQYSLAGKSPRFPFGAAPALAQKCL